MNDLIKKLVEAYGPSGFEDQMRDIIQAEIADFADDLSVDAMGNLIATKHGDGSGLKVMIAAHMDEIGLMVSHITEDGFARFTNIGGIRPQTLMGNRVQFADGRIGVIYSDKLTDWKSLHGLDKHYIDVGASSKEDCPVSVGDAVGFYTRINLEESFAAQLPSKQCAGSNRRHMKWPLCSVCRKKWARAGHRPPPIACCPTLALRST